MTGYFARGTGCCATTSVDCRLVLPDAEVLRGRARGQDRDTRPEPARKREPRERNAAVKPVSRILSASSPRPSRAIGYGETIIPLVPASLPESSNLPGGFGRAVLKRLPIWSCSVRGFACHLCCHEARCALTAPFHHCLPIPKDRRQRCIFCATVRQVTLPGRYPAHCPVEFGLSSPGATSHDAVARDSRLTPAAIVWPGCGSSLPQSLRTSDSSFVSLLAVGLLRDPILLELLVQIAARRVDQVGRLRDVPAGLAQLLHEERPLGHFLVLAQRAGLPEARSLSGGPRALGVNAHQRRQIRRRR